MSEAVRNILVGVMTLIVLLVAASVTFGGKSIGAAGGYVVHAGFNRIDGLGVGDAVRMSGVKIGEVTAMRLSTNFSAVVDLRIDSSVELPRDTSAAIHTDGLFGDKHISLVPGAEDELIAPGGTMELTQDSIMVGDLLDLIIGEARANQAKQGRNGEPSGQPTPGDGGGLMAPLLGDPPPGP